MKPSSAPQNLAGGQPAGHGDFLLARRRRLCLPYLGDERGVLLDFGCGNGAQTLLFADLFGKVVGLDVERDFLADFEAEIRRLDLTDTVRALPYGGEIFPLQDEAVDGAVSFTVLEHVPDQELALREILRVLKPGGRFIISVPNKWWVFETHGANLPLLPWNRVPLVSWWPRAWHDRFARARIYRMREIVQLLRDAGFSVEATFRLTAPMDVAKPPALRDWLRRTIFKGDRTGVPFLATENVVVARKPPPGQAQ